jgi:cytochrome c2
MFFIPPTDPEEADESCGESPKSFIPGTLMTFGGLPWGSQHAATA